LKEYEIELIETQKRSKMLYLFERGKNI